MAENDPLETFEKEFRKELEGITDIDELKEIYAREIARRDKLITELQKQNDIILKTAFKQKQEDAKFKQRE